MKPSEHLALAREEIEKGWAQGTYQDWTGKVCAGKAIDRVALTMIQPSDAISLDAFSETCAVGNAATSALEKVIKELGGESIVSFNDSPLTGKQDMLNAFDKAVAQLQERGE